MCALQAVQEAVRLLGACLEAGQLSVDRRSYRALCLLTRTRSALDIEQDDRCA